MKNAFSAVFIRAEKARTFVRKSRAAHFAFFRNWNFAFRSAVFVNCSFYFRDNLATLYNNDLTADFYAESAHCVWICKARTLNSRSVQQNFVKNCNRGVRSAVYAPFNFPQHRNGFLKAEFKRNLPVRTRACRIFIANRLLLYDKTVYIIFKGFPYIHYGRAVVNYFLRCSTDF